MAVVKAFEFDQPYGEKLNVEITEGPVSFWFFGAGQCNTSDIDKVDELQKALATWVAWNRLRESNNPNA